MHVRGHLADRAVEEVVDPGPGMMAFGDIVAVAGLAQIEGVLLIDAALVGLGSPGVAVGGNR